MVVCTEEIDGCDALSIMVNSQQESILGFTEPEDMEAVYDPDAVEITLSPGAYRLWCFTFHDVQLVVTFLNARCTAKAKDIFHTTDSCAAGRDKLGRRIGDHKGSIGGSSRASEQGLKAAITKADLHGSITIAGDMLKIKKPIDDAEFVERTIEWHNAFHIDIVGEITEVVARFKGVVKIKDADLNITVIENPALPAPPPEEAAAAATTKRIAWKSEATRLKAEKATLEKENEELRKQLEQLNSSSSSSSASTSFNEAAAQKRLEDKLTIDLLKPIFTKLFPHEVEPKSNKKRVMVSKLLSFIVTTPK